jgi:cobalamin-dependent methionine synthase I
MLVIGELLNSTRTRVRKAIVEKDAGFISELARRQAEAGADWVDVNAGAIAEGEVENLTWMISSIRRATDVALAVDSPRASAVEAGLELAGEAGLLNSITAERERYSSLIPLVRKYRCRVVALGLDDEGMSDDPDKVYSTADALIRRLEDDGVPPESIFADPLVRPVSTDTRYGEHALSVMERIRADHPRAHIICGLSNVSYGLPQRRLVNRAFAVMAVAKGLDAVIADPLDRRLMADILAAEALTGRDEFCMNYITASRAGRFEGLD